jgi:hypothetical protein
MYKKVEIPEFSVDKSFANFSKKEAGEYFKWFEGIKADRLEYLMSEVNKDCSSLVLDYSRDSILGLTKWILSDERINNGKERFPGAIIKVLDLLQALYGPSLGEGSAFRPAVCQIPFGKNRPKSHVGQCSCLAFPFVK